MYEEPIDQDPINQDPMMNDDQYQMEEEPMMMEPPKPRKKKSRKTKPTNFYFMVDDEYYYGKLEKPIRKHTKKAKFCALGKAEFDHSTRKTKKHKFSIPLKNMHKNLETLINTTQPEQFYTDMEEPIVEEPMVDNAPVVEEPMMDDTNDAPVVEEPMMDDTNNVPAPDLVDETQEQPVVEEGTSSEEPPKPQPSFMDNITNLFTTENKENAPKGGTKKRRYRKKNKTNKRKGKRA